MAGTAIATTWCRCSPADRGRPPRLGRGAGYDAVIVATGAFEALPSKFASDGRTLGAVEALGTDRPAGRKCIVFDDSATHIGVTVCEALLSRGLRVVLATSAPRVGDAVVLNTRKPFYSRLLSKGAEFITSAQLVGWEGDEVLLANLYSQALSQLKADHLVLIDVRRSHDELAWSYRSPGKVVELVGDAMAPRDAMSAIWEGRAAALRVHETVAVTVRKRINE